MANANTTFYKIKYEYVNAKQNIANRQLLIEASSEKEALELATKRLQGEYRWSRITGALRV